MRNFLYEFFYFYSITYTTFIYLFLHVFSGREFFVGLSQFTNEAGARAVAAAFPEYPCAPIKVIMI